MKKKESGKTEDKRPLLESLSRGRALLVTVVLLLVPLFYFFGEYIASNVKPVGSDAVNAFGKHHLYREWEQKTGEKALWNPAVFCGMPTYHRLWPFTLHIDSRQERPGWVGKSEAQFDAIKTSQR